jgi:membrane protein YdbS with pleckstrin-like domain
MRSRAEAGVFSGVVEERNMHCPACGADIPSGAAFCPGCGHRLAETADEIPVTDNVANHPADQLRQKTAAVRDPNDIHEQELWRGCYSYKAMLGTLAGAALLTLVGLALLVKFWSNEFVRYPDLACLALLWGTVFATAMRRRLGINYRLTNQRFFIEHGVLRRITDRVEVIDINDLKFEQNLLDRMVDVGSITLTTADRDLPVFLLKGIEHVTHVVDLIDQARRAERNRRGLYIESH